MNPAITIPLLLAAGSSAGFAQGLDWSGGDVEVDRWDVEDGLPQNTVNAIAETPDGFLWLGTWGGLVRFDGRDFEVFDLSSTPELLTNRILSLHVDRSGALWIGTLDEGVLRYSAGRFEPFGGAPSRGNCFLLEDGGGLLVADDHRAARFDGERFEAIPRERAEAVFASIQPKIVSGGLSVVVGSAQGAAAPPREFLRGLPELTKTTVRALHVDRHGQIWLGSRLRGLLRVRPASWAPVNLGFPYTGTLRVVPHQDQGVWIAANRHDGLLHAVEGEVVARVLGDPETPIIRPQGLVVAQDGTLWTVHGNYVSNVRGGDTRTFDLGVMPHNASWMAQAADGNLWCSVDAKVCSFAPTARGPEDVRWFGPEDGYDNTKRVSALEITSDGIAWVGTLDALYRWSGGRFERIGAEQGLPRGYVRVIRETSDGSLWVGTYGGGLARKTAQGFVNYRVEDGLPDPAISCILEDAGGNLWMNTNRGAFTIPLRILREHVPGVSPPLPIRLIQSGEAHGAAGCIAGEQVYFPNIRGLSSIHMEQALAKHQSPPLTRITSHTLGENRDLLVRYTSPDLFDASGLRFHHRLVGFHNEWIEAGARREASYTKLPPGNFTFEVAAVDSSGQRSSPSRFELSIVPSFPESSGFKVLAGLSILGVAFGAHRLRMRFVERRTAELQQEIEERKRAERALRESQCLLRVLSRRLLTAQDEERRGIARELHDDVTQRLAALSIQAEVLERRFGSSAESEQRLAQDLSSTAQQLATDVQQLSRRLHPASLTDLGLERAVRSECKSFEERERTSVRFESSQVPPNLPAEVTLTAYRVLQESLHNIGKHARSSQVDVSLVGVEGDLVMTVVDRGRGFDVRARSDGIGVLSMEERARSVRGHLTIDSSPGEGTAIQLRVPVGECQEARP